MPNIFPFTSWPNPLQNKNISKCQRREPAKHRKSEGFHLFNVAFPNEIRINGAKRHQTLLALQKELVEVELASGSTHLKNNKFAVFYLRGQGSTSALPMYFSQFFALTSVGFSFCLRSFPCSRSTELSMWITQVESFTLMMLVRARQ